MKNIQEGKLLIFRQHGKVVGLKSQTKEVNKLFKENYSQAEKEFESARKENLSFGHFDDCGDFYEAALSEAKGVLEHSKELTKLISSLEYNIKNELLILKNLKNEFKECFGLDALNELQAEIDLSGQLTYDRTVKNQRKAKKVNMAAKTILEILLSITEKSTTLFYILNKNTQSDLLQLNNSFKKYMRNEDFKKGQNQEKIGSKRFSNKHFNTIFSLTEYILKQNIQTDDKKAHNQLKTIKTAFKNM